MKKFYIDLPLHQLKSLVGALLLLLLCTLHAAAEGNPHMIPIPLSERVHQANLIVEGEVVSQKAFWDAEKANIYTSSILKVYKVFKGELKEEQVEVITQGGSVGLKLHVVSTSLKLHPGQQGTFFLNTQKALSNTPGKGIRSTSPYGSEQGLIAYDIVHNTAADGFQKYTSVESVYKAITAQTKKNFRSVARNEKLLKAVTISNQKQDALLIPAITSFSPTITSAGTGSVLTINGSGFGSTRGNGSVEFKNADDGGDTYTKPYPREYLSWSDTQIRVYVPSYGQDQGTAGSGVFRVTANDGTSVVSATPITIEFVYSNVSVSNVPVNKNGTFKPLLINKNGEGGYTIQYAPSMQSKIPAQYGFQRAVTSWICNTGVNWKIGEPFNQEKTSDDGKNVIRFAPESEVGDRVLARTLSRFEGFRCGSDTVFFLSDFDMEINSNINWQYGPGGPTNRQYDFETVMLHELGHAHQLGHVIRPREALMHYSVEFDRTFRDLSPADIKGGNFIIAKSTTANVCQEPPMVRVPPGDCNIFANIINQESEYLASGSIEIRWSSTEEDGVDFYVIERSKNGIDYNEIGQVNATGDNSNYVFVDSEPLPFRSFYRVKAVYTNSTARYSTRMTITDPAARNKVLVAPNPVDISGRTSIIFLTDASVKFSYQLYDITGKVVLFNNITFNDSVTEEELDLSRLAGGVYLLKWTTSNASGTEKILVP